MYRKITDLLRSQKILIIVGIVTILCVIWYIISNFHDGEIALIEGPKVPIKVKPTTNGIDVPHQDKEIYQNLTTVDNDGPVSNEQIIDENEAPMQAVSQTDDKTGSSPGNDTAIQGGPVDEIAQLATKSEAAMSTAKKTSK
ncbi:MAG: hypothetical protein LBJ03_03345 [Holosporales bacterium]|jgi:hypothetical protein|nr:hypothetical protein [Holosporales bacterium]